MPLVSLESTLQPMRTSSLRTLPLPDAAISAPAPALPPWQHGMVTLGQVRYGPRTLNEYVDSPRSQPLASSLKPSVPPVPPHLVGLGGLGCPPLPSVHQGTNNGSAGGQLCRANHTTLGGGGRGSGSGVVVTNGSGGGGLGGGGGGGNGVVVSTQPTKALLPAPLKEETAGGGGEAGAGAGDRHSSIICSQCGKCRCAACSEPRDLPVRWCCGDRYEVSANKALDVCSCFCCVQTVFYHCGGEEDNACYDHPCACGGAKCCSRWACLVPASLLLPCLFCYWPLKWCLGASKACYNCCRKKGCQCSRQPATGDKTPPSFASQTRRLLVESESSSSST